MVAWLAAIKLLGRAGMAHRSAGDVPAQLLALADDAIE